MKNKFVILKKIKRAGHKALDLSEFKKLKKKKFTWKMLWLIFIYALIALFCILIILFAFFAKDLPTPSKIANMKPSQSTKLYDRTGNTLIYETGEQKRTIVTSDQISDNLKMATVATEDANFYNHWGFDPVALAKAVFEKISGKTSRTRGASTITQQYVKNSFLTSDRSITRKIKELILSIELEIMYNKDEILTMYLNEIGYGNSTAGAEAASQMYFGISAKDLSISQAATLAAIPQAPTYYSPYGTHTKQLLTRKNYVLKRMLDTKKITQEQYNQALSEDTLTLGTTLKQRRDSIIAPHFAMYVLEKVADEYGEDRIQKEGLKIITTIDLTKQKIAEDAVTANPTKYSNNNASNAALVAIDPKTGEILSMVGSKDYFDTTIDGNVNVADSLRQPGSSFKPIVYSTLFKKAEYSPSKNIFDLQTDFGSNYIPKNYSGKFSGPVTIRYALANSLNIPAVKATSLAGIDNIIRTAEDLGITSLKDRSNYGLSFGLGVAEITPIEMAGAFGVFANSGTKHETKSILKITDSSDKVLYEYKSDDDKGDQVLDPQIAYEISDILQDNEARTPMFGSRSALYFKDRTVAAKTGTTSENKDSWTVGYTPSLVVAVWVGNNQPESMKSGGVMLAAPIFHDFVEKSLIGTANEPFVKPDGIQTVTVEKYSNKLPTASSSQLVTDIFANWQVPTENDDVNILVRLCKGLMKLAPASFSDSLTETRTFTNIKSERPDYSNWENPVRSWAAAAGLDNLPPTDYCTVNDVNSSISFTSPSNNTTVSGESNLGVKIDSAAQIASVEYFVDDISIKKITTSPFETSYNFATISNGTHKLTAIAKTSDNTSIQTSISIIVDASAADLTIFNVKSTVSGNKATISWSTNQNSTSQVYYKKSDESSYTISTIDSNKSTSHQMIIDIISGKTYKFRVVSENEKGESITSPESSFSS